MRHFTEELISECKSGNRKAQKSVFEQLYAPMFRVCLRYVGIHADAEDCLMKGFMKCFNKIDSFTFEGDHTFYHWTKKIMVNESLMFIRQKHNFNLSLDEQVVEAALPASIIEKMNAEEINSLILLLPTGYRTVFNLNVVEGLDHKTIASMLGISENTSRTQLAKARTKLKSLIEQNNFYHEQVRR